MQIKTIKIYGFGKFHDTTIDLSNRFSLLYGENEAGKSTLVAFITSMLFGFATAKHRYAMYQPKQGSQYGGELTFSHAQNDYWLKRVDGTHGGAVTLRNLTTDTALSKDDLTQLLQPLNQELFHQIFCFGERELQAVFDLNRFDLVKRIQRIGAIGSENWIGLTQELTASAGELYKPRGRVQPLVRLLKQYDELSEKLDIAKLQFQQYQTLQTDAVETTQELTAVQQQLANLTDQLNQYQRLIKLYPQYQQLKTEASTSETTPITTKDWQEATRLSTAVKQLKRDLTTQEQAIKQQQQHVASEAQQFYNAHQQQIDQLAGQISAVKQLQQRQQQNETQLVNVKQELEKLNQHYGMSLTNLKVLIPSEQQQIKALFEQQQHLSIERDSRADQRQEHQKTFEKLRQQADADTSSGMAPKWLIAGVGIVLVALFALSGLLRTAGGMIGMLVAGYGIFKPIISGNQQSAIDSQMALLSSQLDQDRQQLADLDQQLIDADAEVTKFGAQHRLQGFAPERWLDLQGDLSLYQAASTQQIQLQEQQNQLSQKIRTYLAQWQFAGDVISLGGSTEHQLQQISQFLSERQDESQRLHWANEALTTSTQRQTALQQQYQLQQGALTQLLSQYHLASFAEFEQRYQQDQTTAQQNQRLGVLNAQLTQTDRQILADSGSQEALEKTSQQLQAQQLAKKQRQSELLKQSSQQQYQLQHLASSDKYQNLLQQQADLQAEITALTDDWLTKKLLINWIDQTLINASQGRQPQIIKVAEQFFNELTGNRYRQIIFTDQTVQVVRKDGLTFDVGELSSGTAEQLYVALRFAFTKVMADVIAMPIIVDDAFVNFDRQRTQAAVKMLKGLAQTSQVIYLTANHDNLTLADEDEVYDLDAGKSV
ncbi:DNA repair ATPase [Secundilactobacillus pentosiphilus]|uniref:DNA repair ATPase n=1 Tax=Secundilactobacillus pentosiphilus TaxID=1714682 RepID=A0A1Z5IVH5_9LACO|nr:AAA family ATPase [Secundilactobacillus pentosiphilus]GAX05765.1 DNA repair ATPase [Secundilactobacillus pentosiphilus]